jgi:hypothetical protein
VLNRQWRLARAPNYRIEGLRHASNVNCNRGRSRRSCGTLGDPTLAAPGVPIVSWKSRRLEKRSSTTIRERRGAVNRSVA